MDISVLSSNCEKTNLKRFFIFHLFVFFYFIFTPLSSQASTEKIQTKNETRFEIRLIQPEFDTFQKTTSHDKPVRLSKIIFESLDKIKAISEQAALINKPTNQTISYEKIKKQTTTSYLYQAEPIFWQGAGLFIDACQIHKAKQKALADLKSLASAWKNKQEKYNSIQSLITFISNSFFQQRIFTPLEPDLFLLEMIPNPLINQNAFIILPKRPSSITLVGAINQTTSLLFKATKTAAEYYADTDALFSYGINALTLISPNGSLSKSKIAYWNNTKESLLPGSLLYVPYSNLPAPYSHINTSIPELLQHRVL